MIEVKLSEEEAKRAPIRPICRRLSMPSEPAQICKLAGLMTVPPWSEDAETFAPVFRQAARTRRRDMSIPELSMGMSNDLEVAIEEGATWVRVGTALFGAQGSKL